MGKNLLLIAVLLLVAALTGRTAAQAAEKPAPNDAVFKMEEVSAFLDVRKVVGSQGVQDWYRLLRGQFAECRTEPDKEVKAYPKLKSKRPLYGEVVFDTVFTDPKAGLKFSFVVDESGKTPPGPSYDRLYFDLNRDLDLTNDPVLRLMKDPPPQAIGGYKARQVAIFDYLTVPFDYGPGLGVRPFRILPRLVVGDTYAHMYFVAPAARKGRIQINNRQYDALLAQRYSITGRFDRPSTFLELAPIDSPGDREHWSGADELCALREVDGRLYTIAAAPAGKELTVKPYRGEFGVLAVGPGGRDIEQLSVRGSIRSRDMAVPLGPRSGSDKRPDKAREHRVPVGDYLPTSLQVQYGRLQLSLSFNDHSDGRQHDPDKRPLFGMKVRKERPFVLDFSNKPEVMFVGPAKDQVFEPGDEVRVAAVLLDPVLDIKVCDLEDTTRKQKRILKYPDGKEVTYERCLSLAPSVTITDSSGKKLAEGKMPFG